MGLLSGGLFCRPGSKRPGAEEAASLRLAQAGVAVARLREGDDVGAVLSATGVRRSVAHA